MFLGSEVYGRQAMNVIACEGLERIVRPETYKQWQLRNLRTGFRQLPLNQEMMNTAKDWVKSHYIRILLLMKIASGCFRAGRDELFLRSLFGGLIVKYMITIVQLRQHRIFLASVRLAAFCSL